jgi:hypothetical protein
LSLGRASLAVGLSVLFAGCGGSSHPQNRPHPRSTAAAPVATSTAPAPPRHPPRAIAILPGAGRHGVFGWTPAAAIRGQTGVWISRVPAYGERGFTVTLVRFDQRLVRLVLHAGGTQPGGFGWPHGALIEPSELRHLVAAFNSGFQESYGAGGFMADGQPGWPLKRGEASVVMYRDGTADIGTWRQGIPAPGRPVQSVRQNLKLLIDNRTIPANVDTCIKRCWGDPLHELPITARSGLGIDAAGQLIWAAGHNLSVRALAEALLAGGAVRAMELDINPAWVAGYLYAHAQHHNAVTPAPLVPGQSDVDGAFLQAYYRDFFTVLARP